MNAWAQKWNIPPAAMAELSELLGRVPVTAGGVEPVSESAIQTRARHEAARYGAILWRNNVGVLKDANGVPVRFGLANDSKRVNTHVKSSDLIGIVSKRIEPRDLGKVLGVFVAVEVKRGGWRWRGTPREVSQNRFLDIVRTRGGAAGFVTCPEDVRGVLLGV